MPHFAAGGQMFGQNKSWAFGQNAAPAYVQGVPPPQHHADGGSTTMSPQDMLASLVASGHLPEHYKESGMRHTLSEIKAHPFRSLYQGLNWADIAKDVYDAGKHAVAGRPAQSLESGFNAASGIPMALSVPLAGSTLPWLTTTLAAPLLGKYLNENATHYSALHPEFRQQINAMSESPLGGALGGDTALASQIMGDRDYADTLRSRDPSLPTQEQELAEYQAKIRANSPVFIKPEKMTPE
jgi:hypothetical protein